MRFNEARKIVEDMRKAAEEIKGMVTVMGVMAVNHYKKSFIDDGFTDESFVAWKKRKGGRNRRKGSIRNASGGTRSLKIGRNVLTKTGRLRRSLTKRNIGRYSVRIESNVPYATVHNEGLRSGRGRGFMMRKRQFVGYSGVLARKIEKKLDSKIKRIFK
jgi:phage gpG-like protein